MTAGLASGTADSLIDAVCRSVTYSDPAAFCVKLHTGDPGSAGTSNAATETTRKAITMAAASGGVSSSSVDAVWTSVAATETYRYVSYWSATSAGTFLGSDQLNNPRSVTAGDTVTLAAGSLSFRLTPIAA